MVGNHFRVRYIFAKMFRPFIIICVQIFTKERKLNILVSLQLPKVVFKIESFDKTVDKKLLLCKDP